MDEYASVILANEAGELLLQLRDDNQVIADPNRLSLFAGKLIPGETKEQAAIRELYEETTIQVGYLDFLFTYQTDPEVFGKAAQSHVFLLMNVDERQLDIREGQGYRKISSIEDLDRFDFALISKEILKIYFQKYKG